MKYPVFAGILFLAAILFSCRSNDKNAITEPGIVTVPDSVDGILVAEKIIQDIVIMNPDPEDAWAEESLRGMNRQMLVDTIFSMVYSQRAAAFDFDTREKLTIRQVKQIEKREDFSREKIGKIQFTESWYLNPDQVTFTKKVTAIVLGYETYDSQGNFRGYLPVFRITLN